MNKLVSVIVPVYNTEIFLERCANSLLNQKYEQTEIILFDDGSTDSSLDICYRLSQTDNRIKVFSHSNRGVAQTRLDAFYQSKGEYITFVDSDDYVSENYICNMVKHLERENVEVVANQLYNVRENKPYRVTRRVLGFFDRRGIEEIIKNKYLYDIKTGVSGITVYVCCKLCRREKVENMLKAGLNLWYGEDQVCTLALLYNISSLYVSEDYDYYYVIHPKQVTQTPKTDLLKEQIRCWQRLKEVDKKELLLEQLPLRIVVNINNLAKRFVGMNVSFGQFKRVMKNLRDTEIIKDSLAKKTIKLKWNVRIVCYLFKFRLYYLLFGYLNLQKIVKKNLKPYDKFKHRYTEKISCRRATKRLCCK